MRIDHTARFTSDVITDGRVFSTLKMTTSFVRGSRDKAASVEIGVGPLLFGAHFCID